jgi:ArsR family transcriptional regulator, arsenate/arsenite/antimonite-responsive transcriptional repressor
MESSELTILNRRPGERCCNPDLTAVLDADEAETLTSDLEVLAHPIRLRLIALLAGSSVPTCVCDLEAALPVKQPTVSHHLRLLRAAGLVESEKHGLWAYYHVRRDELNRLRRRIESGLDRLAGGSDE